MADNYGVYSKCNMKLWFWKLFDNDNAFSNTGFDRWDLIGNKHTTIQSCEQELISHTES